jgi:hypothetical protein
MLVVEENAGYAATLSACGPGSPDPYLCSLASAYASLTAWYAVEHPSQPNYIDLVSGGDQGCHADYCAGAGAFPAADLGGQLSAAGIPWVAWMEAMPSPCYPGGAAGSDATGLYALSSTPRWVGTCTGLARRTRLTARSIRCQASSQLSRSSRAAPRTSHSLSTSMARRSNKVVNRDFASAQGSVTWRTPCSGHATRGGRACR